MDGNGQAYAHWLNAKRMRGTGKRSTATVGRKGEIRMEVTGILEHLPETVRRRIGGMSSPRLSTERERLERIAEEKNQEPGYLPDFNCEICRNRGEIWVVVDTKGGTRNCGRDRADVPRHGKASHG